MTLRQANYNSHFLFVPAPSLARQHLNTTSTFRTLNIYGLVMFRLRAAICAIPKQKSLEIYLSMRGTNAEGAL